MPLFTYAQLMAMSEATLIVERNRYMTTNPEYDRINEHVQYRAALQTFGESMKTKGKNGPVTGLETPPVPPSP